MLIYEFVLIVFYSPLNVLKQLNIYVIMLIYAQIKAQTVTTTLDQLNNDNLCRFVDPKINWINDSKYHYPKNVQIMLIYSQIQAQTVRTNRSPSNYANLC